MNFPHTFLMLKPNNFGYNFETKSTNSFQNNIQETEIIIKEKAIDEFNSMVETLKNNKITVEIFNDKIESLPDSVFMNNWISTFPDGKLIIYPIFSDIRRKEKRIDLVDKIIEKYDITEFIDLSHYEADKQYLEGTGSVVFDYDNKIAYACLSERTSETVFNELCKTIGYKGFVFNAENLDGKSIYHTNVMMSITKNFAIVCLESISDPMERSIIKSSLKQSGKTIIEINFDQLNNFSANSLEVYNEDNESLFVLSATAESSLSNEQKMRISENSRIVPVNIPIIERVGGGSARCMITSLNC
jgi:hypothetical protein